MVHSTDVDVFSQPLSFARVIQHMSTSVKLFNYWKKLMNANSHAFIGSKGLNSLSKLSEYHFKESGNDKLHIRFTFKKEDLCNLVQLSTKVTKTDGQHEQSHQRVPKYHNV